MRDDGTDVCATQHEQESSSAATPLRLSIYIARCIYRSLHRATLLLAHILRITRHTVSYGRFTSELPA